MNNPMQTSPLATLGLALGVGVVAGLVAHRLSRRGGTTAPAGQLDLMDPMGFQPAIVLPMIAAPTPKDWIDRQFTPQQFVDEKKRAMGDWRTLGIQLTAEELISTCPTEQEILALRKQLGVVLASERFLEDRTVTKCDTTPTIASRNLYNLLRLAAHMRFGKLIPVLEAHSLFDFMVDKRVQLTVVDADTPTQLLRPRFPGDLRVSWRLFEQGGDNWDGLDGMGAKLLVLAGAAYESLRPGQGDLARYWYALWLGTQAGELLTAQQKDDMLALARSIEPLAR